MSSTIWVGAGSSEPTPENICAKTGTMKVNMAIVTASATTTMTDGYIMAPLTLRTSLSAFSR